tara:strand:+ start:617 stop:1153 length:537 start_codon:yes stop_codon:yes gene_type:complete
MKNFRKSFTGDDFPEKKLPEGHREEFLTKLESTESLLIKKKKNNWVKIAAALLIVASLGFLLEHSLNSEERLEAEINDAIALQLREVEIEYITNINTEWKNFLVLATDEQLIQRYRDKLAQLDTDYKEISKKFENNKNNIGAVEDIIRNLQTRLTLLKDIQEHIKLLNQKSEPNEKFI